MAVLSLTWKSPYVDKTVFILRQGPGGYLLADAMASCSAKASAAIAEQMGPNLPWGRIPTTHTIWAPSQYKDRLIYVWRFPC